MADTHNEPGDRRPVRARAHPLSHALAGWLVRRGVRPNSISLLSSLFAALAGAAFASTSLGHFAPALWIIGALFCLLRLLAHMLDGMVAIAAQQVSPPGELYNELPDRFSDLAILIGLGYAAGGSSTAGYLAACGALATAYVRVQGRLAGGPQSYVGPMAKPHRMFLVSLAAIPCAMFPPDELRFGPMGLPAWVLVIIAAGCFATCVRRLRIVAAALARKPHP